MRNIVLTFFYNLFFMREGENEGRREVVDKRETERNSQQQKDREQISATGVHQMRLLSVICGIIDQDVTS